jgi:hypothetical protein
MKGDLGQFRSGQPSRSCRGNSIVDRTAAYPREESDGVESALAESEERLAIFSSLTTAGVSARGAAFHFTLPILAEEGTA